MPTEVSQGRINYQQGLGSASILPGFDPSSGQQEVARKEREGVRQEERDAADTARKKKERDDFMNFGVEISTKVYEDDVRKAVAAARENAISQQKISGDAVFTPGTKENKENLELQEIAISLSHRGNVTSKHMKDTSAVLLNLPQTSLINREAAIKDQQDWYESKSDEPPPNPLERVDMAKYLKGFMVMVPTLTGTIFKTIPGKRGDFIEKSEVKGKFYKMNDKGTEFELDDNGQPILEVPEQFIDNMLDSGEVGGFIYTQLDPQKHPENEGKDERDIAREYLETKAIKPIGPKVVRSKGFSQQRGYQFGDPEKKGKVEDALTHLSMALQGSKELSDSGQDDVIETKDGDKNVVRVESLFTGLDLGEDEFGDKIYSTAFYMDPDPDNRKVYIKDSKDEIREFDKSNVSALVTALATTHGDITTSSINEIRAYIDGMFDTERFWQSPQGETTKLREKEKSFQKIIAGQQTDLKNVLGENLGWFNNLTTSAGDPSDPESKLTNPQNAEKLQGIIADIGGRIVINGEEYKNPIIETNNFGNFVIRDSKDGKQIGNTMYASELGELFNSGKAKLIPSREYLDKIGQSSTPPEGEEEDFSKYIRD